MNALKEELRYRLPEKVREALNDVQAVIQGYAIRRGDPLMAERDAAENILTDLMVRAMHQGEDYRAQIDTAVFNAREITGLRN